jgi:hypothetical protein
LFYQTVETLTGKQKTAKAAPPKSKSTARKDEPMTSDSEMPENAVRSVAAPLRDTLHEDATLQRLEAAEKVHTEARSALEATKEKADEARKLLDKF